MRRAHLEKKKEPHNKYTLVKYCSFYFFDRVFLLNRKKIINEAVVMCHRSRLYFHRALLLCHLFLWPRFKSHLFLFITIALQERKRTTHVLSLSLSVAGSANTRSQRNEIVFDFTKMKLSSYIFFVLFSV